MYLRLEELTGIDIPDLYGASAHRFTVSYVCQVGRTAA
jgi:hypothetical protein